MTKRSTLADVARAASVSKTTASMALNNKGAKIPIATRDRVIAAADRLQFRPHGVARALVRRRADVLGVVCTLNPLVEMAHHAFEQALLSAVFYHALEAGYNPMIHSEPPEAADAASLHRYADGRSDAFILLYPPDDSLLLNWLARMEIPVVAICRRAEGVSWVDSDNEGGIRAALDHLIELGHRRIAYLAVEDSSHTRVVAFRRALQEYGLTVREDWIVPYRWDAGSTEAQIARFCAEPEPPTALLTWNDIAAVDVYMAAGSLGLRIPQDLSIVGFDDISAARGVQPSLTTIRQDVIRMGRAAVDLTLGALSEEPASQEIMKVVCPVNLCIRQSTAPPPKRS